MELSRRTFLKLSAAVPMALALRLPIADDGPVVATETTGRVLRYWARELEVLPAGDHVLVGPGAGMLAKTTDIYGCFYENTSALLLPVEGPEKHIVIRLGNEQARLQAVDELQEGDIHLAWAFDSGAGLAVEDRREYLEYRVYPGGLTLSEWGDPEISFPVACPEPDIIFKES